MTLGCKVNQYETQFVKEALQAHGHHEAEKHESANLCVVNTCTVTAEGDAKSRQAVRRLHKHNPKAKIVVMGCYATRDPETVGKLPGVYKVITDKQLLLDELNEFGVSELPSHIQQFDGHQRAFVKVQDGCLLNCSYCIIPSVRPHLRSRAIKEIVEEVRQLVASGYQEIVLTGIHLGHYGIDLSKGKPKSQWQRLWHLLEALALLPGDFRVRMSSLEAAEVRDDLVKVMRQYPKIVPHFHLCLQSGSDRILRQMKRRYTAAGFLARCQRLRDSLDLPAFTTDVIIGFPGETDDDFAETCRVVREVGFSKIHIFSYSTREGTEAAAFRNLVDPRLVARRRQQLQQLEAEQAEIYQRQLIGRKLDVLVESAVPQESEMVQGTSCRFAQVRFQGYLPALQRKIVPVHVDQLKDGCLYGTPIWQEMTTNMTTTVATSRRRTLPVVELESCHG